MLVFFRSSNTLVVVVILLAGVLTWLNVLNGTEAPLNDRYGAFLFQVFTRWLDMIPGFYTWLAFLMMFVVASILIYANARLHLNDKISYLPALCYILLIGGVPIIQEFNPVIVSTLILAAVIVHLTGSFENEQISYRYFNVSVLISIGTFFFQYLYLYMIVVWVVILLWRPGYWREWVFSLLGFAFPLFITFSWFFLVEGDLSPMGQHFSKMFNIQRITPLISTSTTLFFVSIIVLVVLAFGQVWRNISSKKTAIRTGYYLLILVVLVTLLMVLIIPDTMPQVWYFMACPLSLFLSNFLANVKSKRIGVIVLTLLFVLTTIQMIM